MLGLLREAIERMSRAGPSYTIHEGLGLLVERAAGIAAARACTLRLYEPGEGVLALRVSHGLSRHYHQKPALKVGQSVAGEVFRTGSPTAVADLSNDRRYAYPDYAASEGLTSLVSAPLLGCNGPRGTLTVYYDHRREHDQGEIQAFGMLANVLGLALESAALHAEPHDDDGDTVSLFVQAMEEKHPYTRGHSERVAGYAAMIAREMGLPEEEIRLLETVCRLHDLGKLSIDLSILDKNTILDREDFEVVQRHPDAGAAILAPIPALHPHLGPVRSHHERLDGLGYPDGLSGDAIDPLTRIVTVADAYDAMTSERPYSAAFTDERARRELEFGAHTQFDADVVQALFRALARERSQGEQGGAEASP